MNNNQNLPHRANKCVLHGQTLTHLNSETKTLLCEYCLQSQNNEKILDLEGCLKNMQIEIPQLKDNIAILKNTLGNLSLPKGSGLFKKEVENMSKAKQNVMIMVEEYFDSLFESFARIYSQCPNTDSQTLLQDEMTQQLESLQNYARKLREKNLDIMDVKHFYDDQLSKKTSEMKEKIK